MTAQTFAVAIAYFYHCDWEQPKEYISHRFCIQKYEPDRYGPERLEQKLLMFT